MPWRPMQTCAHTEAGAGWGGHFATAHPTCPTAGRPGLQPLSLLPGLTGQAGPERDECGPGREVGPTRSGLRVPGESGQLEPWAWRQGRAGLAIKHLPQVSDFHPTRWRSRLQVYMDLPLCLSFLLRRGPEDMGLLGGQ